MLEYQKSSPAYSLDEKTAACRRVIRVLLAQFNCFDVALF